MIGGLAWLAMLTAQQPNASDTRIALPEAASPAITPGTVAIVAGDGTDPATTAARAPFAAAVETALLDAGYTVIPSAQHARYAVRLNVSQTGKGAVRSAVRAGGGSGMLGPLGGTVGGGVSIGLSSGKTAVGELVATELGVSITRRGEAAAAWEGRAVTYQVAGTRRSDLDAIAGKLAAALFQNFPQGSGQTVSVP